MFEAILLAAQLAYVSQDYAEAKALADANEASLSADVMSRLLQAQGDALASGLRSCAHPEMDLSKFTVVFVLDAQGSVVKSWREGETPLARCMHRELSNATFKGPWTEPFYTSIELTLSGS